MGYSHYSTKEYWQTGTYNSIFKILPEYMIFPSRINLGPVVYCDYIS